jgi:hypothetical protein
VDHSFRGDQPGIFQHYDAVPLFFGKVVAAFCREVLRTIIPAPWMLGLAPVDAGIFFVKSTCYFPGAGLEIRYN